MSKCMTCQYALYDGMCLAQGKFTPLDAQACDDYKPRIDVEVSKLQAENAKLRELVRDMWVYDYARYWSSLDDDIDHRASVWRRMCELGIEAEEWNRG